MKDLIKSFLAFGFATTVEKIIAFILVPLYVNVFSVSEFGLLDLIQVTVGVLSVFGLLQFESALQRYYYEYEGQKKKRFVTMIYGSIFLFSLTVVSLGVIFSSQLSLLLFDTKSYSKLLMIALFQIPFNNVIMLSLLILRYEKDNIKFTFFLLSKVIITLLLILYFVLYLKKGVEGVFIARLVSGVIISVAMLTTLKKYFQFFNIKEIKKIYISVINYSLPLFPASIGSVFSGNANRYFISTFLSLSAVGIYAFSLKLASVMQMIYVAFIMAWWPFVFSKIKEDNHKEYLSKFLLIIEIPIVLIIIWVSLLSKEIIDYISPVEYHASAKYVSGLILYFSLFIFKEVTDIGPKVTENTKFISYNFFVTLFFNLVLLYFLINLLSLEGVVIAMILTNTILVSLSWFVSYKLYPISFPALSFIVIILPAYILSISLMFFEIIFVNRIIILVFVSIIYVTLFFKEKNSIIKSI